VPLGDDGLVPVGVIIYAKPANIARALEGYIFKVDFATSRGVERRDIRFTGEATDKGLEAMVVG